MAEFGIVISFGFIFDGIVVFCIRSGPANDDRMRFNPGQQSWMTMSVQIGFVVGALFSAAINLADRVSPTKLIGASALLGALFNALIPLYSNGAELTLILRFLTGVTLAGVYPPGMKTVATWAQKDRGLGIGLLVGALTLGSALPHLLNAVPIIGSNGMPPWRNVLLVTSGMAMVSPHSLH